MIAIKRKSSVLGVMGIVLAAALALTVGSALAAPPPPPAQVPLPGTKIPQFVDPLPVLDLNAQSTTGIATMVAGPGEITLNMLEFQANIMPSTFVPATGTYTGTWTFGYRVATPPPASAAETPVGPVIVATRGTPTQIRYVNNLTDNNIAWRSWTDQSLHSAFHQIYDIMMPTPGNTVHYPGPIPAVPHLHGGEVPAVIDGGPEAYFLSDLAGQGSFTGVVNTQGPAYYTHPGVPAAANEAVYRYPNSQEAAPLWFHDHLLGGTRINATFAGLAGAYPVIDPSLTLPTGMNAVGLNNGTLDLTGILGPTGANTELLIPLVMQDRMFDTNGQLFFPITGVNPEHPFWVPEFVGDTIIVNGKVWPYLNVDQKRYRFYLINGSNSRPYDMFLEDGAGIQGPPIWVIATDGGYLDTPVLLNPNASKKAGAQTSLMMMPGERYEIIIDFADPAWLAQVAQRKLKFPLNLVLRNVAATVNGKPNPQTVGKIMQIRVSATKPAVDSSYNPTSGTPIRTGGQTIVRLPGAPGGPAINTTSVQVTRELTLNEVPGPGGPFEALVNNSKWNGLRPDTTPIEGSTLVNGNWLTEIPNEGDIEVWEIINLTMDSHPIHLHGVQFQLIDRQAVDMKAFMMAYNAAFPGGVYIPGYGPPLNYFTGNPRALGGNPDPVLLGAPLPQLPYEAGWKDTVIMRPGERTRISVRIGPQDVPLGTVANYTFVPNAPGSNGQPGAYVWHCHITDHEDNEMMRPDMFVPNPAAVRTYIQGADY